MAGDEHRDRVRAAGTADGAGCAALAEIVGDLAVAARLTARDAQQLRPDAKAELGSLRQVQRGENKFGHAARRGGQCGLQGSLRELRPSTEGSGEFSLGGASGALHREVEPGQSFRREVREEIAELEAEIEAGDHVKARQEFGDVLFVCANLARKLDIDPEDALRSTNAKFVRRFHFVEDELAKRGRTPDQSDLDEMDALWEAAKRDERAIKPEPA